MFGEVISFSDNIVKVKNLSSKPENNILNYHVVFPENDRKIVGEIVAITSEEITINLLGQIKNDIFSLNVIKKPSFKTSCRIITKRELEFLLGSQDYATSNNLLIGNSSIYENYKVTVDINDFLSHHFAVVGNSGSGKSCGIASIIQNIFSYNDDKLPINAHIILFDTYGEYNSSLNELNKIPNIFFKNYTTCVKNPNDSIIKIPSYFLGVDEIAILLNANNPREIPVIENALKLCYIFTSKEGEVVKYKNDIIAKTLLDILTSGKNGTQIRDQVMALLTQFNTDSLNLNTVIEQPGYNRTLKQCLNIDNQGKINNVSLIIDLLEKFSKINIEQVQIKKDFYYTLDDLYYALEFALMSEGKFNSSLIYDNVNNLKLRLHAIINSENKKLFEVNTFITKEQYIKSLFSKNGQKAQIINLELSGLDDRFATVITKLLAKIFLDFTTSLEKRTSFPIHIIIEEAHRYIKKDSDTSLIGYNIFDRIAKEGRKYGVLLGVITQRPSELSETVLSQCSNFIVFKTFYPKDLEIIKAISSNMTFEIVEKIKTLAPGNAITFGGAFKILSLVDFILPRRLPESSNVNINEIWYSKESNYE